MAAFIRKYREGIISERDCQQTIKEFKKEYSRLILVQINPELDYITEDLHARHSLRGFDAFHLASALAIKRNGNLIAAFACFDNILNDAAAKEGLDTPLRGKG
jgi:predicted nucleic acid-binding protein